jgi:uncharacterized DUF497 family protein
MALEFEWDLRKAEVNLKEHGVSFDEATTVLRDTLSITIADPDHSDSEDRFVDIGMSHRGQLLVVSSRNGTIGFESLAHDHRHGPNGKAMKKQTKRKQSEAKDTMRPGYDFSKGVRGKHAARYAEGTNVVVLEPDVAREFRTTEQVNETLRAVSKMLQQHRKHAGSKTA